MFFVPSSFIDPLFPYLGPFGNLSHIVLGIILFLLAYFFVQKNNKDRRSLDKELVDCSTTDEDSAEFASLIYTVSFLSLIEVVQPLFDRSSSFDDFSLGLSGACFSYALFEKKLRNRCVFLLFSLILALFGGLLLNLDKISAYRMAKAEFPVLGNFDEDWEMHLWIVRTYPKIEYTSEIGQKNVFSGKGSLSLSFGQIKDSPQQIIGIERVAFERDWSGYTKLLLSVSVRESSKLVVRIDDIESGADYFSRYNQMFVLEKGWNNLEVELRNQQYGPKDRELILKNISRVVIFFSEIGNGKQVSIDSIRLE